MKTGRNRRIALTLGALVVPFMIGGSALGADQAAAARPAAAATERMWLACENGRNYPIRPLAISREGDLVTGYLLWAGRGHAVHLRLVPMGVGYRYAGPGVWFDGLRNAAVLDWGTRNEVPCTVVQQ
jgi:hypothetical protein